MCDPTMINTGDRALRQKNVPSYPLLGAGGMGGQQIGLAPQLATQLHVAPTPRLEAPRDCVEQPGFCVETAREGRPG